MVAGEFAVLLPHHHLAVTAVNRFVYATIKETNERTLTLEEYGLNQLRWDFTNKKIEIQSDDERLSFVKKAMEVTCRYLAENGVEISPFHLAVRSELDDQNGIKYGLGSSAAVVVAVVTAIFARFRRKEDKDTIFKLAALAHVSIQGSGSGADVAASVYGGVLQYSSFQAEWLLDVYREASTIREVIEKEWVYWSLKRLTFPSSVSFHVGWTGKPASTTRLVDRILELREIRIEAFDAFIEKSERAVEKILHGIEQEDTQLLFTGIHENREALATVGEEAGVSVETPLLKKLSDVALEQGGAGKLSGAGGGDCGIAFMPAELDEQALLQAWKAAGIKPLDLKPNIEGITIQKKVS